MSDFNIGVLGAGVVGLTTALQLQNEYRNAKITIIAENFKEDTTSFVAPGLFKLNVNFSGATEDITKKWVSDAYNYWNALYVKGNRSRIGILQLSGYSLSNVSAEAVRNAYMEKVVPIYRRAKQEELQLFSGDWKYGSFITTLVIESARFLPWATEQFLNSSGKIIKSNIKSFSSLVGKYDVVVNCTGLGAQHLCSDNKVVPIRGQIRKVCAPWIKIFVDSDVDTYIIPGFNAVTLGGCRNYDSYNLNWCKYDDRAIQERCEAILPDLKTAPLIDRLVGLRPHRSPVRVEKEILRLSENKLKIVHNYGHGSYGVTTAPGTAKNAVKLVKEFLTGNSKL